MIDHKRVVKNASRLAELYDKYIAQPLSLLKSESVTKKYADCIVANTDNEVLLLQRSSEDILFPGKWCLPGGHVEEGESFSDAAKRELFEETGLAIQNLTFLSEREKPYSAQYFYALVKGRIIGVIDNNEHYHVEWVPFAKLDKYDILPDHKELLKTAPIAFVQDVQNTGDIVDEPLSFLEELDTHFEALSKAFDDELIDEATYISYLKKYKAIKLSKSLQIIKLAFDNDQISEEQYITATERAKTIATT